MTNVVVNSNAYSDDGSSARDMRNGGFRAWFLQLIKDTMAEIALIPTKAANAASAILNPLAAAAAQHAGDASWYWQQAMDRAVAAEGSALAAASYAETASDYVDDAAAQVVLATEQANSITATSTTSLAVSVASKSLTIQTNKQFVAGQFVQLMRTSAPTTTYMQCTVTSYTKATGALVLNATVAIGSGTYTDWTIALSGKQGADVSLPNQATHATKVLVTDGTSTSWQAAIADDYQEFTASGTWTKPARAKWVYVELVGGGGSGGAASGSGSNGAAKGGGPGQWRFAIFRAADLPATVGVTIPFAATAVAQVGAGATQGNAGGSTDFGAFLTALGGNAGAVTTGVANVAWVGIDAVKAGGKGGDASSGTLTPPATSTEAGNGGAAVTTPTASVSITATSGSAPGGGGGAASCSASGGTGTLTSGAGSIGRARIWTW